MTMNIKRRLIELERLDAPAGMLPLVLADDASEDELERMRRQGLEAYRLRDFVDACA
jgi:hypothetical protein